MKYIKGILLFTLLGLGISYNDAFADKVIMSAETNDYESATSIDLNNLSKEIVKNNGNAVSLKDMDVDLLCGNVLGQVSKFQNYIQDGETVLISNDTKFDGATSAAFAPWRFKTTSAQSAIFKITAKSDIKLTITHPEIKGGWIDEHGQYFALYTSCNDKMYLQWSKDIKSLPQDENAYGGDVMLKEGDIAYYVFGSTIANERNVQVIPVFTSSVDDYDENIRNSQMVFQGQEKVNMWDAITSTINNNYDPVSYNSINVGFYYGTMLNYTKFSYNEGKGLGEADDALWSQVAHGDGGAGFLRWQIQCDDGKDAIIVVKALQNTNITISHSAIWDDPWSKHTTIKYYGMDEENNQILIKEYPIVNNSGANYFTISVNLKENESLIIDYTTLNGQWGSLNFAPVINSDTTTFDATKTLDFSAIKALAAVKEEKLNALKELYESLDEEDYSLNNWGNIEVFYNDALNAIQSAQDETSLIESYEFAVNSIQSTKTLKQENEELVAYRKEKIDELDKYYNEINKKDYSKENYEIITNKVEEFKEKISKATSKTSINTLYKNVVSQIEKIEKNTTKGCNGSVSTGIISLASLMALLLLKKKH